jgi:hypothetical protein
MAIWWSSGRTSWLHESPASRHSVRHGRLRSDRPHRLSSVPAVTCQTIRLCRGARVRATLFEDSSATGRPVNPRSPQMALALLPSQGGGSAAAAFRGEVDF